MISLGTLSHSPLTLLEVVRSSVANNRVDEIILHALSLPAQNGLLIILLSLLMFSQMWCEQVFTFSMDAV